MNKDELIKSWEKFAEKNDFKLNPDVKHVDSIAKGVLKLEKEKGMKYCPCRIVTGDFDKDIELLCPCNFKIQDTWKSEGRCWCGLFVKE